ncbi:MAG: dTDP-4-dehydrorhamnose reductase [Culicoidibacterales bacterium]
MKILVTGVKGQLGYDVVKELEKKNIEAVGIDREEMDLTDTVAIDAFFENQKFDAIIHCAAYTAVDNAEDDRDTCYAINVSATKCLAENAKKMGAKFLYVSTDYVFPGTGEQAYEVDAEKGPTNHYGVTKLQGEEEVKALLEQYFIVRISWVFGINGNNFIKTMLKLSETRDELSIVDDQIGSPTYTADLAPLLVDMIQTEQYGEYNASNEGFCSWADFATEIFKAAGKNVKINRVDSSAFPTKATRPKNSRMSKQALLDAGFIQLPKWEDAVSRYVKEIIG